MGLFTGLLTLPLAPVEGVVWVARRVEEAAERELYDPAVIRAELAELLRDLETGVIDEATYDEREEELLDRFERGASGASPAGDDSWAGTRVP